MDQLTGNVAKALLELIETSQQTSIKQLEDRIEKLETSSQELIKENAALKENIGRLGISCLDLTKENVSLKESMTQLTQIRDDVQKLCMTCEELSRENATHKNSLNQITQIKENLDRVSAACQNLTKDNFNIKESLESVNQAKDILTREQADWIKLGTTLATSVRDLQTFTGEIDSKLRTLHKQVTASTSRTQPESPYRHQPHPTEMILELTRHAGKLKGEIDVLNSLQRSFDHGSSSRNHSFTTSM